MKSTAPKAIVVVMIDDRGNGDPACHAHPFKVGVLQTNLPCDWMDLGGKTVAERVQPGSQSDVC